jgi:hypothetical protein
MCVGGLDRKRIVSLIDRDACNPQTGVCDGVCFEGPYDYVHPCVAGFGPFGVPFWARDVWLPNPIISDQTCGDMGFTELFGCPYKFFDVNNHVCLFENPGRDSGPSRDLLVNGSPYIAGVFGRITLHGTPWRADNPYCKYQVPDASEVPLCNEIAGRYSCPIETCVSNGELVSDDDGYTRQEILIQRKDDNAGGNGFYGVLVLDHPTDLWNWNATMFRSTTDPNYLEGIVHSNSKHPFLSRLPNQQITELYVSPNEGCKFYMSMRGFTAAPDDWPSSEYNCNWNCERIRN